MKINYSILTFFSLLLAIFQPLTCNINPELKTKLNRAVKRAASPKQIKQKNIIKKAEVPIEVITIAYDKDGYPLPAELEKFLNNYWKKKATAQNPHSQKTFYVKPLKCGGSFTGKIFCAYFRPAPGAVPNAKDKPIFFLKISNAQAAQAWDNLRRIQESAIGRLGIEHKLNNNMPIIMSVERFFTYKDHFGDERTIELTLAARGIPITSVFDMDFDDTYIRRCARKVGTALGLFHQAFMRYNNPILPKLWRTYIHGDAHFNNIYFHDTKDFARVYFIDTETMVKSLHQPQLIDGDLFAFIFYPILFWRYLEDNALDWEVLTNFYLSFMSAYITSYPEEKRMALNLYVYDFVIKRIDLAIEIVRLCSTIKKHNDKQAIRRKINATLTTINNDSRGHYVDLSHDLFESFFNTVASRQTTIQKTMEQKLSSLKNLLEGEKIFSRAFITKEINQETIDYCCKLLGVQDIFKTSGKNALALFEKKQALIQNSNSSVTIKERQLRHLGNAAKIVIMEIKRIKAERKANKTSWFSW